MLFEELAPFIIQQQRIGLKCIMNAVVLFVFLLKLDGFLEKIHAQQGRLTALPGKFDINIVLGFDILPDVGF